MGAGVAYWLAESAVLAVAGFAAGQCSWVAGEGIQGVNGPVDRLGNWDPDGAGPDPPFLIVGGSFSLAGRTPVSRIAAWRAGEWVNLGAGLGPPIQYSSTVKEILQYGDDLVVAGSFQATTGAPGFVALWDGEAWRSMGSGLDGPVNALVLLEGDLIAGGSFMNAGAVPVSRVARWNGESWSAMGAGLSGTVLALAVHNGMLKAGGAIGAGQFTGARLATWNGTSWDLGPQSPVNRSEITALAVHNGVLCEGYRYFDWSGQSPGAILSTAGVFQGLHSGSVQFLRSTPEGLLIHWQGSFQRPPGAGQDWAVQRSIVYPHEWAGTPYSWSTTHVLQREDDLVAAGSFQQIQGTPAANIARYRYFWRPLSEGNLGEVTSIHARNDGDLFVGGLEVVAGVPVNGIANWDGHAWRPLGCGLTGAPHTIQTLGTQVFVGGSITVAGCTNVLNAVSWDGSRWLNLGGGVGGGNYIPVASSCVTSSGELVLAGSFSHAGGIPAGNVAGWNGTTWSTFESGLIGNALVVVPWGNGFAVGGFITAAGGTASASVAFWENGWNSAGAALEGRYVTAASAHQGDLFVSGSTSMEPFAARWNGTDWLMLPAPPVSPASMLSHGGDLLLAGGDRLLRWGGSSWTQIADVDGTINVIGGSADSLYIGGDFSFVNGIPSQSLARRSCGCYANCDGSLVAPVLNVADFTCFLQRFAAGDSYANCDQSTALPVLNVADFTCFLQRFAAGCP